MTKKEPKKVPKKAPKKKTGGVSHARDIPQIVQDLGGEIQTSTRWVELAYECLVKAEATEGTYQQTVKNAADLLELILTGEISDK